MGAIIPRYLDLTRPVRRWTWVILAILALTLAGCGAPRQAPQSGPTPQSGQAPQSGDLPVFRPAPAFTLTDQLGRSVSSDRDLRGKVLVVNFIYTHCTDTCPLMTAQMAHLQQRLVQAGITPDQVQLVSITVDPARDTPEVLRKYADKYGADPKMWHFLTGPVNQVRQVVTEGFRIPAETPDSHDHQGENYLVAHSDLTVLVDRQGQVRAYYPINTWDTDRVLADVQRLVRG